jgi:hypothetical protein
MYSPSLKAKRRCVPSSSNPNFLYRAIAMSFQMTKRFGVRFHALIDEVGCEQLEVAEA